MEGPRQVAQQPIDRFGLQLAGSHPRISRRPSDNARLVALYDGREYAQSTQYDIHIADRVG